MKFSYDVHGYENLEGTKMPSQGLRRVTTPKSYPKVTGPSSEHAWTKGTACEDLYDCGHGRGHTPITPAHIPNAHVPLEFKLQPSPCSRAAMGGGRMVTGGTVDVRLFIQHLTYPVQLLRVCESVR
jgi:hypothetical protein